MSVHLRRNPHIDTDGHDDTTTSVLNLWPESFEAPDEVSKLPGGTLILTGVALGANDPDIQKAVGGVGDFMLNHPIDSPEMQGHKTLSQITGASNDRTADDELRRDPNSRVIPDPEARSEAHTTGPAKQ